jgi:tetratricopeptide (TPR) repeat protein
MPQSNSSEPVIFVSYARADEPRVRSGEDERWLTFVMSFLRPAVKRGLFTMWSDTVMPGGEEWEKKIEEQLRRCDVFVLLVSTNSMGSDFILDKELAPVKARRQRGESVHVYPILLEPTSKASLKPIAKFNLAPRDGPLSGLQLHERKARMAEMADEIAAIAAAVAAQRATSQPETRVSAPDLTPVDIGRLPDTPYRRLVGREALLKRLDDAWAEPGEAILSLVADGGAGKSALVNAWLLQLQAEGYRDAKSVLGWSFTSQGSERRVSAADEFLDWALKKLGLAAPQASAVAKGEAIAGELAQRRILLVLDGVEPLQHGPGAQAGQLRDPGLRELLRRLAASPPSAERGLVLMTSRLKAPDIGLWKDTSAPVVEIKSLTREAGAELLRENGVWGTDAELEAASEDYGGHPLALSLLSSLLTETQNGDARRRDHFRGLLGDGDDPLRDHASQVLEAYESEWLADKPELLAIMRLMGLFDRAASGAALKDLRKKPIAGLTDSLAKLDDVRWKRNVARLREVRLLLPADAEAPEALDAHPLVREWFGERLRTANETAWKAGHSRLFDYLRQTTHEGERPTLPQLVPLYQSIAHGCQAGRHKAALEDVYLRRICRFEPGVGLLFYAEHRLGAFSSSLASHAWFFDRPYDIPSPMLSPASQASVLGECAFFMRAQGRVSEALPLLREAVARFERENAPKAAALNAINVSETELVLGQITDAIATARRTVVLADQADPNATIPILRAPDLSAMVAARGALAQALHAAGRLDDATSWFAQAERLLLGRQPQSRWLSSLSGYQFCDLLLAKGEGAAVRERATWTLTIAHRANFVLDIALDTLTLARADLLLALHESGAGAEAAVARAKESFETAVSKLRAVGELQFVPAGHLARAAFRRTVGDWQGAERDLDEAREIAKLGQMRLVLCDLAIERARLALARRGAFAPLNRLANPSGAPAAPQPTDEEALLANATAELDSARQTVEGGYRRRAEELAELDAVASGVCRFSDLPPRV